MERIDALEAVRRLTLERDALAEQVRRLEGDALQAPGRRERPDTGTEPTEGANGAPRGCNVPLCACCKRPVLRAVFCDACESRAADRIEKEPQKWDGLFFGGVATQLKEQYDGTQTCEGCKHWDASAEYEGGYHDCHRHAPTVGEYGPAWPRTTRMSQCGDWEAK